MILQFSIKCPKKKKRKIGAEAVEKLLSSLTKNQEYIDLLEEFEQGKTPEAAFAKMCDKLKCDIQVKLYCEEGAADLFADRNKHLFEFERVRNRVAAENPRNLADLFIENDRKYFNEDFLSILDYIKENEILKILN